MSDAKQSMAEAEDNLARAKVRFVETLHKLEHSFSPGELVDHAGDAIHAKLLSVGQAGMEQVRKRPITLAAGAVALAAFIARRSIWKTMRPDTPATSAVVAR